MRQDRQYLFWIVALVVAIAIVAFLRDTLLPFVAGATLAYFFNPLVDQIERTGIGRTAATTVVVGLVGLAVFLAIFFLLPLIVAQLRALATSLPGDLERIRVTVEAWAAHHLGDQYPALREGVERALMELKQGSSGLLASVAKGIWDRGVIVFNVLSLLLVTPIVVFYLLRDWHGVLARVDGWLPREYADTIRQLAGEIDRAVGAFVRGQGTICLLLGVLYAIALSIAGLRYGMVIGLLTGLMGFVPFVGWALGLITALVVALTQGGTDFGLVLTVLAIYAGGMAIDAAILAPNIVGQKIGLHPVWLIFALLVFSAVFGFLGVLVAVPVAAAVGVIVRFALGRYLGSSIYLGEGGGNGARAATTPTGGSQKE